MDKLISFAYKEMSIFCFSDDQDWRKFCFACLVVLCYILRIRCHQLPQM